MTQIDKDALQAATNALFDYRESRLLWGMEATEARARVAVEAYLAALPPPAGDVAKLIEVDSEWIAEALGKSIANLGYPVGCGIAPHPEQLNKAATIIAERHAEYYRLIEARAESAEARLAECERDLESRKNYTDADYVRLHKAHCMTADKLAECERERDEARKALLLEQSGLRASACHVGGCQYDAATARVAELEAALSLEQKRSSMLEGEGQDFRQGEC